MSADILERIRRAENLPSLPTVAIQILQMTRSENVSLPDMAAVIQQDPALTGKILRLANSSLFGLRRRIASPQQAIIMLGLRTTKVVVLSFSLADSLGQQDSRSFDYRLYWRRSLTTAVLSRLLAERIDRDVADESFVAGLLCDIGILAAVRGARGLYRPVLARYQDKLQSLQDIEKEVLGATHEEIGAALLDRWSLPGNLSEAVRSHHQPLRPSAEATEPATPLTRLLRAAAMLADVFVEDTDPSCLPRIKEEIGRSLELSQTTLDGVLEALDEYVKETATLFAINIGETLSHQEIEVKAVAELAGLSGGSARRRA